MKKTIQIAPYTVEIEETQRITHVLVRDEHGKQVLRANYNKIMERYDGIKITVKQTKYVHEVLTVMDTLVEDL